MPLNERPRERLMRYGANYLSDVELLTLIIGNGGKQNSAMDLAYMLLSENDGFINLCHHQQNLKDYVGIGNAVMTKLEALFELCKRYKDRQLESNSENIDALYVYQHYLLKMKKIDQEHLFLLILDRRKQIICEKTLAIGNEKQLIASSKIILSHVLGNKGRMFYLIHNHPCDTLDPSTDDLTFTLLLENEARQFGLTLIDHLIITSQGYYSLKNHTQVLISGKKDE